MDDLLLRIETIFYEMAIRTFSPHQVAALEGIPRTLEGLYPWRQYAAGRLVKQVLSSDEGIGSTPWHNDKRLESLVNEVMDTAGIGYFVETGTYLGDTARYMASMHPEATILTCEIDPVRFEAAKMLSRRYRNLRGYNSTSPSFLKKILPLLVPSPTLFWLDAHWGSSFPLLQECKILSNLDAYVLMIDDFEVPGRPGFGHDSFLGQNISLEYVSGFLGRKCFVPAYEPAIVPAGAKHEVKGYGVFFKGIDHHRFKTLNNLEEISI
jgi:hypothetical protein